MDFELLSRINCSISSSVLRKNIILTRLDTNLPRFQGARNDHVRVESSSRCFPSEVLSFVRPRELDCFYPWHVTRSCPPKKAFELIAGGITTNFIRSVGRLRR